MFCRLISFHTYSVSFTTLILKEDVPSLCYFNWKILITILPNYNVNNDINCDAIFI